MDSIEIQELRKKQFVSINLYLISLIVIVGTCIYLFELTRLIVWSLIIVFMAISCLFTWREMEDKGQRISVWQRQLAAYEKEKLGQEWFKWKRSELSSKLILIVLLIFQLVIGDPSDRFMPDFIGIQYMLFFLFFLIVLTNLSLFFRNRKIDRLTTEELQGFTKRENGKSFIIGIIFALIIIGATFTFIINL